MGMGQIMATLLVVLPTLAFSVTFLLAYWNIMQVDYKLKLIANKAADIANSTATPRSDFVNTDTVLTSGLGRLCPGGRAVSFSAPTDADSGEISITVQYTTSSSDTYLSDKTVSTLIQTYSFHDQNMSITITCPTI